MSTGIVTSTEEVLGPGESGGPIELDAESNEVDRESGLEDPPPSPSSIDHARLPFPVTLIKNDAADAVLCKVLEYDEEAGRVKSTAAAHLWRGTAEIVRFKSLRDFMEFRDGLQANQALVMGLPTESPAQIVTKARLSEVSPDERREKKLIARDRAHFSWSEGPVLVMLDLDRPDQFPEEIKGKIPKDPEGWRELLCEIVPELEDCPMAWAPSSSSYLYRGGEELHGLRGQRFYIILESGMHVPAFVTALRNGLIQRGLFWYTVSKSGNRLLRSPFDFAVFGPEHLDFAARPECEPPLESRPEPFKIWNEGGPYLSKDGIPTFSPAEESRIESRLEGAKQAKAAESQRAREQWLQEASRRMAAAGSLDLTDHQETLNAALDRRVLLADFPLIDKDGEFVTVGELLANPQANHGREFHDPLEPDYRDDPRIAVFLKGNDGQCRIYSHAHGGQTWLCAEALQVVELGLTHETVDEICKALAVDPCGLYRKGDAIVTVNESDATIHPIRAHGLGLRIGQTFKVVGRTKKGAAKPKDIPVRALETLVGEPYLLPIPQIKGVTRGPFVRSDGSIVDEPGYDFPSEVLYISEAPYPPVARREPTPAHVQDALRRIWYAFRGFPLETEVDRGAVLTAIFSAACRLTLERAPGYMITASEAGAGKTTLGETLGAIQTGSHVATSSLPLRDEEIRKQIFAMLRAGSSFLLYDNVERGHALDSPVIANIITSPIVTARVLGVSVNESHPNRLTLVFTGNNIRRSGDLNRRIIPITLETSEEHPFAQDRGPHPVSHVLSNWTRIRIDLLEVVQGWHAAGAPRVPDPSGFSQWDEVPRSVVAWIADEVDNEIGFADPGPLLKTGREEDPEAETLGRLMTCWHGAFGDREIRVSDVFEAIDKVTLDQMRTGDESPRAPDDDLIGLHTAVDQIVMPESRPIRQRRKLGQYLAKHEGRVVEGLHLVAGAERGGARLWRVQRVGG